jgi:hypothetical protein
LHPFLRQGPLPLSPERVGRTPEFARAAATRRSPVPASTTSSSAR